MQRNYKSKEYTEWKNKVRRRDKCKCQMPNCTKSGRKCIVHHIKKWADYPSLRFHVKNGICLCYPHHKFIINREEEFEQLFSGIINKNNHTLVIQHILADMRKRKMDESHDN